MVTATRNSSLGPRLGRYEITRLVAMSGDRGAVFCAIEADATHSNQRFALTVMDTRRMVSSERDALFERWSISSSLTHPALVPPLDRGGRHGVLYVVTAWLDGVDLEQFVTRHVAAEGEPLGLREVITIGTELAEVLGSIHEARDPNGSSDCLVHGRVALTRVFMMRTGNLRVLGFPGTPEAIRHAKLPVDLKAFAFLAPEQLRGEVPQIATDVYSLALLVLAVRLGRNPLERTTLAETEQAILTGIDWGTIEVEPALRSLLQKSLSLNPDERPRSARWLANRMLQFGAGTPLLPSDWRVLIEDDFPRDQSVAHAFDQAAADLAKILVDEVREAEAQLELEGVTEEASRPEAERESAAAVPAPLRVTPPALIRPRWNALALVLVMAAAAILGGAVVGIAGLDDPSQARALPPVTPATPQRAGSAELPHAVAFLDGAEAAMSRHDNAAAAEMLKKAESAGLPTPELQIRFVHLTSDCELARALDAVRAELSLGNLDLASVGLKQILGAHPTNPDALALADEIASDRASVLLVGVAPNPDAEPGLPAASSAAEGRVDVSSEPAGVVYLDGVPIGTAPITGFAAPAGDHTLEVRLGGHEVASRKVTVARGKAVGVDFKLTPTGGTAAVSPGTLDVVSEPPGVVYVDGTPIGTSPIQGHKLPPGQHAVEVRLGGHADETRAVVVESGGTQKLQLIMRPK